MSSFSSSTKSESELIKSSNENDTYKSELKLKEKSNLSAAKITNDIIVRELKSKKIHFREQIENLWINPESLNLLNGYSLIIPGTKCPMLKNFIGVKILKSKIYLVESSNRITFKKSLKKNLVKFINYLNLITPIAHFCITEVISKETSQILISANRVLSLKLKDNCTSDFIEEILTIDKIYQQALIEHLPSFLFKEFVLTPIFNKEGSMFEVSKFSVIRSIKAMGFTQEKVAHPKTYTGNHCSISLAVNLNVGKDYEQDYDWRVMPIVIDIFDQLISIKVKLCKNKHVVKIENEHMQALIVEFINLANLNLKKAQFRFSYSQLNVYLEGPILTTGLDCTEIQFTFQQTFSYIVENFKKYGGCLAKIYSSASEPVKASPNGESKKTEQTNGNTVETDLKVPKGINSARAESAKESKEAQESKKISHDDVRNMYKSLIIEQPLQETGQFTLFYLDSSYNKQAEMLVPQEFESRTYGSDYSKEKLITENLKSTISECFHLKLIDQTNTIKYPSFDSGQCLNKIEVLSSKQISAFQEFLYKLYSYKFSISNPIENLGIARVGKNHFIYFSSFPIYNYLQTGESVGSKSLKSHLIDLKLFIEKSNKSAIAADAEEELVYLKTDDFDSPFNINTGEANLAGFRVVFEKVSEDVLKEQASKPVKNLPHIANIIGFYNENNNYYIVMEKLEKIHLEKLDVSTVRFYLIQIIQTIFMYKDKEDEVFLITEEDLYINESNRLKIVVRDYKNHSWQCISLKKDYKKKQVYNLAMLVYRLICQTDPFAKLSSIPPATLKYQLENDLRIPIFEWKFEQSNPQLVSFLRKCWNGEIESLDQMRDFFPLESMIYFPS